MKKDHSPIQGVAGSEVRCQLSALVLSASQQTRQHYGWNPPVTINSLEEIIGA
jgi:hypothetical protein